MWWYSSGQRSPAGCSDTEIPEFKMEKAVLDRRLGQLKAEGVEFRCGISVGQPAGEVSGAGGRQRLGGQRPVNGG